MSVPAIENLRRQRLIPGGCNNEMDMSRAHGMPIEELQQSTGGTVKGNRVAGGTEAVEAVCAVPVGDEAAAEVHIDLLRVLLLIEAVGGGVPDVELGVGDGCLGASGDDAAGEVGVFGFRA